MDTEVSIQATDQRCHLAAKIADVWRRLHFFGVMLKAGACVWNTVLSRISAIAYRCMVVSTRLCVSRPLLRVPWPSYCGHCGEMTWRSRTS